MSKIPAKSKVPPIICPTCLGAGWVPLPSEMMRTLDALRSLGDATTTKVSHLMKWSGHITAINNRLAWLARLGLATRKKEGRYWIYAAKKL